MDANEVVANVALMLREEELGGRFGPNRSENKNKSHEWVSIVGSPNIFFDTY